MRKNDAIKKLHHSFLPQPSLFRQRSLSQHKAIIKIPDLLNYKVIIKHSPLSFQPFKSWNKNKPSQSLPWWEDYNKT